MFRGSKLRQYSIYTKFDWTGGIYATATTSGSRNGSIGIGTWVAMMRHGKEGYLEKAKNILKAQHELKKALVKIPHVKLLTKHNGSVVSVSCDKINPIALADYLHKKGWAINKTQNPAGFHLAITQANYKTVGKYADDIREAFPAFEKDPSLNHTSDVSLYGTASAIPDKNFLDNFVKCCIQENLEVH